MLQSTAVRLGIVLALAGVGAREVGAQVHPTAVADGTYLFTRRVGLGASVTFARAHIPFGASDAGGLHVAGGLRVRL